MFIIDSLMYNLKFKRYLNFVSLGAVLVLVLSKSVLRPWAKEHEVAEVISIILGSIPNFLEPLVGVPAVTGILLMMRHDRARFLQKFSETGIYFLSIFLASIYAVSQELKIHSLGGNNTYDPNDIVASVLGLLFMLFLMLRYGFIKTEVSDNQATAE